MEAMKFFFNHESRMEKVVQSFLIEHLRTKMLAFFDEII